MINKSLLFAAALAGAAVSASAFPTDAKSEAAPRIIPSSVVQPTGLPREFAGAVVNVEFRLDQAGQPRDIHVLDVSDTVLKRQLVSAFRQWRFTPAADASAKRFILPVQLNPEA